MHPWIAYIDFVSGKKQRKWSWDQNGVMPIPLLALHSNLKEENLVSLRTLDVTKECWGKENICTMPELRKRFQFIDFVILTKITTDYIHLNSCFILLTESYILAGSHSSFNTFTFHWNGGCKWSIFRRYICTIWCWLRKWWYFRNR
jgi:hypothetical protein